MAEKYIRVLWLAAAAQIVVIWNPDIIYGVSIGDENSIREIGQWVLLLLPMFLSSGRVFEEEWNAKYFTAMRYGSYGKWWRRIWFRILIIQITYICFLSIATYACSNGQMQDWRFMFLLFFHMQLLFWVVVLLYLIGADMSIAAFTVLLIEGISLFMPVRKWWVVGIWGMYNFSDLHPQGRFPVWLVFGIQILVLVSEWIWMVRKRLDYSRVC